MIAPFWTARSPREQFLLATLGVLFAAFVGWYGVALPLQRAAASADAHRARAAQAWADVQAGVTETAGSGGAGLPDGGIEEAVMASAEASGVALERNRVENAREITVWAKGVDPGALFAWMRTLQKAHGVAAANVTAVRDADGALDVELRFMGAAR